MPACEAGALRATVTEAYGAAHMVSRPLSWSERRRASPKGIMDTPAGSEMSDSVRMNAGCVPAPLRALPARVERATCMNCRVAAVQTVLHKSCRHALLLHDLDSPSPCTLQHSAA